MALQTLTVQAACRYTKNYLYSCAPTDPTDPWGYVLPQGCTAPDVVRTPECLVVAEQHIWQLALCPRG